MQRTGQRLGAVLAVVVAAACSTPAAHKSHSSGTSRPAQVPQGYDTIKAGDTLWSLAKKHGCTVEALRQVNHLTHNSPLRVGQVLRVQCPPEATPVREQEKAMAPASPPPLTWPLAQGVLFSEFGPRQGNQHDGIDLGAPEGTAIVAAAKGQVMFVGSDQGAYGLMVILGHEDDRVTVYAHNQANLVKEGEQVAQGQVIALVGHTGAAQTPHVHFEVRQARVPVDPVPLLPEE